MGEDKEEISSVPNKIGKVNKTLIEQEIVKLYSQGKISDSHYQMLKDKIADFYGDKD